MYKRTALALVLILSTILLSNFLCFYAATPVHANPNDTITSTDDASTDDVSTDNEDDDFKKESRNWFQQIGDALSEILSNVKSLFTDGLKTLLEKTIGGILESYFQLVSSGMSKWVFLVPSLWNSNWISQLWWICFMLSIGIFGVCASLTIIGYLTGKKEEFNGSQLLKSLFVAMFFSSISYVLASGIVEVFNYVANTFANTTLWEQYQLAKTAGINNPLSAAQELTKETISFQSFDGIDLCKMAFNGQAISGPFYEIFLSVGGLISMIISMLLLALICIFGFLRYLVIGALAAGAPIWFSICAYTGDTQPAWGWTNIFARTVLLSFFYDLAWIFSVAASKNIGDFMGSQQLIATFLFLIAFVLSIVFWFLWLKKAIMAPLTLAGADARSYWGDKMEGVGTLAHKTGSRFGVAGLKSFGNNLQAQGREQQQIADEIKRNGHIDYDKGSVKNRLQNATLNAEREFIKREGIVDSGFVSSEGKKDVAVERQLSQLKFNNSILDSNDVEKVLSSSKSFYTKDDNGSIKVDQNDIKASVSNLKNEFEKEHMVQGRGGDYTLKNLDKEKLDMIENELINKNVDYQKTLDNRLMIPDSQKNKFLDTLISFDDTTTTAYKDNKRYSLYNFKTKDEAKNIYSYLQKSLPSGALNMEDDKVIAIEDSHTKEANKLISEYSSYTPYWQEGDYYYYKDYKSGKVIAHLNPPEKGRKIKN